MSDLEMTLLEVARELARNPGTGGHVHFDDPAFHGEVPDFTDVAWITKAAWMAERLSGLDARFLVVVPLGEWPSAPPGLALESLTRLHPWEPPALYILTSGSAFDERRTNDWFSDEVPQAHGIAGWLRAYRAEDATGGSAWRVSLAYETQRNAAE
jgi:hypothetical protein